VSAKNGKGSGSNMSSQKMEKGKIRKKRACCSVMKERPHSKLMKNPSGEEEGNTARDWGYGKRTAGETITLEGGEEKEGNFDEGRAPSSKSEDDRCQLKRMERPLK